MQRKSRIDEPYALHRIIARGINHQVIFFIQSRIGGHGLGKGSPKRQSAEYIMLLGH